MSATVQRRIHHASSTTTTATTTITNSTAPLLHPIPADHFTHHPAALLRSGSYTYPTSVNISRLEKSAEEMSAAGSDLGEEILRRMNSTSSSARRYRNGVSRNSSVQSSRNGEIVIGGRGDSTRSSRANSTTAARRREASITSPAGSISHQRHASGVQRQSSASTQTRLAPTLEDWSQPTSTQASRQVSGNSFAARYDEIAGQIEHDLEAMAPAKSHHDEEDGRASTPPQRPRSSDTYREAQIAFRDFDGVHFSPPSLHPADGISPPDEGADVVADRLSSRLSLAPSTLDPAIALRPVSLAGLPPLPPPGEGMVYYPAPVPRMLNLPKRLSQLPAASAQANRRSQMLSQLSPEARAAGPWLTPSGIGANGRRVSNSHMSAMLSDPRTTQQLPPQLRASAFFDHPSVPHAVELQNQSAVATLDSILAASATAPVTAFTDHPFAGDVRRDVYAPEPRLKKSMTTLDALEGKNETTKTKRRSGSIPTLFRRSTQDLSSKLEKRNSRASLLTDLGSEGKLRKRRSVLSLGGGDQLDQRSLPAITPGEELDLSAGLIANAHNVDPSTTAPPTSHPATPISHLDENQQILHDFAEAEADSHVSLDDDDVDNNDDEDPNAPLAFVPPSTLLAELQVRKAQLKSRNRTAATAFPRGMHSTLLQLDAVEEIAQRKRQHQRIALAWEDPVSRMREEEDEDQDEDVPLGVLFPGRDGSVSKGVAVAVAGGGVGEGSWGPGLMEKRAREDSEPLARRRERLRGGPDPDPDPDRDRAVAERPGTGLDFAVADGQQPVEAEEEEEAEVEEEETLAQRQRRMKTKSMLDTAIADVIPGEGGSGRPNSTFTDDLLSQFGGSLAVQDPQSQPQPPPQPSPSPSPSQHPPAVLPAAPTPSPGPDGVEETLGQRKARLQRERTVSGKSEKDSAPMPSPSYQPAQGSLLHTSAQQQAKHQSKLLHTNLHSSFSGLGQPLISTTANTTSTPLSAPAAGSQGGLLARANTASRAPSGGFGGGVYNNGAGGVVGPLFPPASSSAAAPSPAAPKLYPQRPPMQQTYPSVAQSPFPMIGTGTGVGAGTGTGVYPAHPPSYPHRPGLPHAATAPYGMMSGGGGGVSPGNFGGMMMGSQFMGNAFHPGMANGTYAAFAQSQQQQQQQQLQGGVASIPAANMGTGMGMNMMARQPVYATAATAHHPHVHVHPAIPAGMTMGPAGWMMDEGLSLGQRDAIDRWRMSVAP